MVRIHVERIIDAPQEQVFGWLSNPRNLTAARLILKARWRKGDSGPRIGAAREALATGMWFREEITAYDPPNSYSYLIIRVFPPLHHQGGTLTFAPTGGGTRVDWQTTYTHPAWMGGAATAALTSRVLRQGFLQILDGCARELEK